MKTILLQETVTPEFGIGTVLGSVVVVFLYFLPAILGRKKRQATALLALNFLLGWTVLGWIGALIWALSEDAPAQVVVMRQSEQAASSAQPAAALPTLQGSVADELAKLVRLRDSGALTEAEFAEQKMRVLGATPAPIAAIAAAPVPTSIQMAQLRHRHHRGEISTEEFNEQFAKLSTRS